MNQKYINNKITKIAMIKFFCSRNERHYFQHILLCVAFIYPQAFGKTLNVIYKYIRILRGRVEWWSYLSDHDATSITHIYLQKYIEWLINSLFFGCLQFDDTGILRAWSCLDGAILVDLPPFTYSFLTYFVYL